MTQIGLLPEFLHEMRTFSRKFELPTYNRPGKSAAKMGTGIIDINNTTQEIRQDLQPNKESAKEFNN